MGLVVNAGCEPPADLQSVRTQGWRPVVAPRPCSFLSCSCLGSLLNAPAQRLAKLQACDCATRSRSDKVTPAELANVAILIPDCLIVATQSNTKMSSHLNRPHRTDTRNFHDHVDVVATLPSHFALAGCMRV